MKPNTLFLPLCLLGLLCSCGQGPTPAPSSEETRPDSSESSVSPEESSPSNDESSSSLEDRPSSLSFQDAADILLSCVNNEGFASEETRVETTSRDAFSKVDEASLSLFKDDSSLAQGTISTSDAGITATYARKVDYGYEKIRGTDTNVYDLKRRYEAKIFDGDDKANDVAYKMYVFHNENEAAGFEEGSYLLQKDAPLYATFRLVEETIDFLALVASSPYLSQMGIVGYAVSYDGEAASFSLNGRYSLTEEGIRSTYAYAHSFRVDLALRRLLSFSSLVEQEDVSLEDASDKTVARSKVEGSLTYGEKAEAPVDAMQAKDYFLTSIEEVALLNASREEIVDETGIALGSTSYVFAKPKVYLPSTARDVSEYSLTPVSSTSSAVIALEETAGGNYFSVVGAGEATLRFAYYGLSDLGVYEVCYLDVPVRVYEAEIESVSFSSILSPEASDNTLLVGRTYKQTCYVSPSYARGSLEAVSSDPTVLKVTIENGTLSLTPKAKGSATIRVSVAGKPGVFNEETFDVIDPISPESLPSLLQEKPWSIDESTYGWTATFTFLSDGKGKIHFVDNVGPVEGTFTYAVTLKGNVSIKGIKMEVTSLNSDLAVRFSENAGVVTMTKTMYKISFASDTMVRNYVLSRAI